MDAHSVVDDWDAAPFDGGFAGLDELASRGFSGAVESRGTWLFLGEGEPLAVVSDLDTAPRPGDIDAFDGAAGQRHEAPNGTVATLAAMLALDGDVRGEYFTDDTPLEAVDETLSGGGFTGYVELSENVLSGDYFFVYVDGEVDHVGFVGSSQLLLGEDAEARATGEVGIYAVTAVELPRPDLPSPPDPVPESEPEPEPAPNPGSDSAPISEPETNDDGGESETDSDESATTADDSDADAVARSSAVAAEVETADANRDLGPDSETGPAFDAASDADAEGIASADSESDSASDSVTEASSTSAHTGMGTETTDDSSSETTDDPSARPDSAEPRSGSDPADPADPEPPRDSNPRSTAGTDTDASPSATSKSATEDRSQPSNRRERRGPGGIEAVTTRTVPSLDPENSGRSDTAAERTEPSRSGTQRRSRAVGSQSAPPSGASPSPSDRVDELREEYESKIDTYESRIEELETSVDESDARIEELEAELDALRAERDELQARLDAVDSVPGTRSMSSTEALSGTSLFVRETTRGEATLEDAHDGTGDRETVESNLRIEYHTTFDDESVSVDGEPFESWLTSSDTYAFVEWLVMELLFEVRSTGSVEGLRPLYDALPGIDRIGFDETVAVGDGTEGREVTFDIVARDKKGRPLVVIEFDRQRDPTRAEAIEPFVTDASDVCEDHESLAGAVAITSSYFESDAMSAVEEATSTSLLSRSKHRSYVKLSRSNGYHLCLVEARDGSFNLTVPEL